MNQSIDVCALGELLIDFTKNGESAQGNSLFEANPGGAPCNVLAMLTKLGHKTAFIGKVGDDMFGKLLKERTMAQGIDMSGLFVDRNIPTTLAFVQTYPDGDRDFSFYRKPGADVMLTRDEVVSKKELLENCKIFHFGSLSMTSEECDRATREALTIAKDHNAIISFDPNLRPPLWESESMAKDKIIFGLENCDVLKISDNEIEFMTGTTDIDLGVKKLMMKYDNISLIFATLGKDGSKAFYKDMIVEEPGFANPKTIETTGAGDTFCASALHFVLTYGLKNLDEEKLHTLLTFANAAASLITTKKGALAVMPTEDEVKAMISEYHRD